MWHQAWQATSPAVFQPYEQLRRLHRLRTSSLKEPDRIRRLSGHCISRESCGCECADGHDHHDDDRCNFSHNVNSFSFSVVRCTQIKNSHK